MFDRLEGESGKVRECRHLLVLVSGAKGVGSVFDEGDLVLIRDGAQFGKVAGIAAPVHANDRLGFRRDLFRHTLRAEVASLGIDVRPHDPRTIGKDGNVRCHAGHGGRDHFITVLNPRQAEREVEGGSARIERENVWRRHPIFQFRFKRFHLGPWPMKPQPSTSTLRAIASGDMKTLNNGIDGAIKRH